MGYGEATSTGLVIVIGLAALGVIVWSATSGVWMVLKRVGRTTHVDEPVDRFFDGEGRLDPSDYIRFKDQHPHGGSRQRSPFGWSMLPLLPRFTADPRRRARVSAGPL